MNTTPRASFQPISLLTVLAMLAMVPEVFAQQAVAAPPNAPAIVAWDVAQGRLSLRYHGAVILDGKIRAEDAAGCPVAGVEIKLEQPPAAGEKVNKGQRNN